MLSNGNYDYGNCSQTNTSKKVHILGKLGSHNRHAAENGKHNKKNYYDH